MKSNKGDQFEEIAVKDKPRRRGGVKIRVVRREGAKCGATDFRPWCV